MMQKLLSYFADPKEFVSGRHRATQSLGNIGVFAALHSICVEDQTRNAHKKVELER